MDWWRAGWSRSKGASVWLKGSSCRYASEVKHTLLGVPEGPVVSEVAARVMASNARRILGSDIGLVAHGGSRAGRAGR